jgi:N-acetylneuraminic acid mutarotase
MIVWGGANQKVLDSGGIYDFVNNTWKPTNPTGAPTARAGATAVWADTMMLVWGGTDAGGMPLNTGGKFDPKTNTWTPINPTGAPTARKQHTAVWNGSAMIVWGGNDGGGVLDSGASYDPKADTWKSIMTGPSARSQHTAVWTGTQMMIWGGLAPNPAAPPPNLLFADGAGYNPAMDMWDMTVPGGAIPTARYRHTAVWTSTSMLVFGGAVGGGMPTNDGGQLKNMTWASLGIANQPEARQDHTAVWIPATSEMVIWGGEGAGSTYLDSGYRLGESSLAWTPIPAGPGLLGRARHTAVAAGTQMIIWGGEGSTGHTNSGGIFDTSFK